MLGKLLAGRATEDMLELELVKTMILMKEVYSELFRQFGIETFEWHVLVRLAESEAPSQSELAARLLREKVAITRVVASLIAKGLVERSADPDDGRKQRIRLTPRGRRLVPEVLAARDDMESVATGALSSRDRLALRRILGKIQAGYAGAKTGKPRSAA